MCFLALCRLTVTLTHFSQRATPSLARRVNSSSVVAWLLDGPTSTPQHPSPLLFTRWLTKSAGGAFETSDRLLRSAFSASRWTGVSPNPPKDTDGRREDRGRGVRELQGDGLGSIGVDGRSADALQPPHRALMAACESWDARDGERIRSRELSRTGMSRV